MSSIVLPISVTDLASSIKGDVITPGQPGYEEAIHRWACNAEKRAAVVVFTKEDKDVSAAIHFAKEQKLPIAIRGGGHNPTGASSVENGLVIDLSRYMNGVRVDPDKKLAYVGGGALWGTVDKTAIEHGLATVGGTVNHTGVGGLTLGGGFGYLSGQYGLTIDNLVQATVISADGISRTASETENTDLYFGIRGGGCNFGVVTEFVLKLYPQRRTVFAGPAIFPGNRLREVADIAEEWYATASQKEALVIVNTCPPDQSEPIVICSFFYNGSEEEGRANFKKFYNLGPVQDLAKEIPYEELNSLQNSMAVHRNGTYWKGVAHEGPNHNIFSSVQEKVTEIARSGTFNATIVYEYVSMQKICSISTTKTAFRRVPRPNALVTIGWPGDGTALDKSKEARPLAHDLAARIVRGQDINDEKSVGYSNYATEVSERDGKKAEEIAKLAFGENYPTLQRIKKKYDPENIFNRWIIIPPA